MGVWNAWRGLFRVPREWEACRKPTSVGEISIGIFGCDDCLKGACDPGDRQRGLPSQAASFPSHTSLPEEITKNWRVWNRSINDFEFDFY